MVYIIKIKDTSIFGLHVDDGLRQVAVNIAARVAHSMKNDPVLARVVAT